MSKEKIEELTKRLNAASYQYYNEGTQAMPDQVFDHLLKELENLEKEFPEYALADSPTNRVGSDHAPEFEKVAHRVPMISIDNAYSLEAVTKFIAGLAKESGEVLEVTAEPKIDGLSLGVQYENGVMVKAVTRGDGAWGDDVTENARTIQDIPLRIKSGGSIEVRGECYMERAQFNRINARLEEEGEEPFKNPRGAASGSLKTKDTREVARRNLRFRAFGLAEDNANAPTQEGTVSYLAGEGFPNVNGVKKFASIEEFDKFQQYLGAARALEKLPFDIDGIVIKVNQVAKRAMFGRTGKHVKWAIAFKFNSEQAVTRVLAVTFQTGRTGKVVPVAELEPVPLMGATIKRATLHNMDEIGRLQLCVGDTVVIEKGGDIIPKIISVDVSKREPGAEVILQPQGCPECGAPLHKIPGMTVDVFCSGDDCPAKILNRLKYFVSRNCMNIMDLGESLLEKLLDKGVIKEPMDLYNLAVLDFDGLDGVGPKTIGKILDNIDESKKLPPSKLLAGLGISRVGKNTSAKVMAHFQGWEGLWMATYESLAAIPDVGEKAASNIEAWIDANPDFLTKITDLGMNLEYKSTGDPNGALAGETVVVTGTLSTMSREEAQQAVEESGGKFVDSVSKKTTILVIGADAGATKQAKAEKYGTKIFSEIMFLERLGR